MSEKYSSVPDVIIEHLDYDWNSIIKEIKKGQKGGFYDESYIIDKLLTIIRHLDLTTDDLLELE
tara:strand:- start:466 stop:657 length:192 start_codon:yes stop_codon:yes gene_type:complete